MAVVVIKATVAPLSQIAPPRDEGSLAICIGPAPRYRRWGRRSTTVPVCGGPACVGPECRCLECGGPKAGGPECVGPVGVGPNCGGRESGGPMREA